MAGAGSTDTVVGAMWHVVTEHWGAASGIATALAAPFVWLYRAWKRREETIAAHTAQITELTRLVEDLSGRMDRADARCAETHRQIREQFDAGVERMAETASNVAELTGELRTLMAVLQKG